MTKEQLKKRIDAAAGRIPSDVVIKNAKVIDVFGGEIINGDIAIVDGYIVGVGSYEGEVTYDAKGLYASPGLIDGHIHIESSYVTPEELGRMIVPCGTTTIIADPHEIVNVKGISGLEYMLDAAEKVALDVKYMLPSCVPATSFETAGDTVTADDMKKTFEDGRVLGLAEFMDYPGVINATDSALERLLAAHNAGVPIDGHSPCVLGNDLNAYTSGGITTDHECTTPEELRQRIARGMYVLMRQGSACHDLEKLLKGVTPQNTGRCLLCSDDLQPKTIFENGHLNNHLRICIRNGFNPVDAIRMATINAAQCYRLNDRGAIAPGRRADIVLFDNLEDFKASKVFVLGDLVAENGAYLPKVTRADSTVMQSSFRVKDFSADKLKLTLKSDTVHTIELISGSIIAKKTVAKVNLDTSGDFVRDENVDIVKIAVVERHKNTGNVAVALLQGYGIKAGAVALSVAHDSHNIIVAGTNDADMAFAVETLIAQDGGIVLAKDGVALETMLLPVGGIMSDQSGEWVNEKLQSIHHIAHKELGISGDVEPVMTLCFMSLPVIPELKLTDKGLFDVAKFGFISVEV